MCMCVSIHVYVFCVSVSVHACVYVCSVGRASVYVCMSEFTYMCHSVWCVCGGMPQLVHEYLINTNRMSFCKLCLRVTWILQLGSEVHTV